RLQAGAERAVHDRPLRNLMERMIHYAKEGTEAFDDPFPIGGRGPSSRVFEGLGRPPLVWEEEGMPRRLSGPRPIFSLG
ncbi:MAG: hypothetical protein RXP89_06225, partial [Nitrososphaeria archaeon]